MTTHREKLTPVGADSPLDVAGRLLFAIFICSMIFLAEKWAIVYAGETFHTRSSRSQGQSLDELLGGLASLCKALAIGNPDQEDPISWMKGLLDTSEKSFNVGNQVFSTLVQGTPRDVVFEDVARFFHTAEEARFIFSVFDRDSNASVTEDEMQNTFRFINKELTRLKGSSQDWENAVGHLDKILLTVCITIAIYIIVLAWQPKLASLITGVSAFFLALSWLIGGTLSEILNCVVFLFIKHPFEMGDWVEFDGVQYLVHEVRILSTVFLDRNDTYVQTPNLILNSQTITNIRRSPQISEDFLFELPFHTSQKSLEVLKNTMLQFLAERARDYRTSFDLKVTHFVNNEKLAVQAKIHYRTLLDPSEFSRVQKRNAWIFALKDALLAVQE
ncbi:Mechanosensitive ion channel protein [Mycena venus]|uniref:Mechanosensitive ion channel protein n=1 Tax=Mycena venus TaxID=2733690 RepID=A0A8H7DHU2_9AGAR|nr:Mechanosensitive ion channel protein [Mycena venus]